MNNNDKSIDLSINKSVWLDFIEQAYQAKKSIAIFLNTGVKLQGHIIAYDEQALRLKCTRDKTNIIVFCSNITTVSDREANDQERGLFG